VPNRCPSAIWAIERSGRTEASDVVVAFVGEENDQSDRRAAAYTLGNLADQGHVELLVKLVNDRDARVKASAAKALTRITGQRFGEDPHWWKEWLEEQEPRQSRDP
jgi:HEAT repeat protein